MAQQRLQSFLGCAGPRHARRSVDNSSVQRPHRFQTIRAPARSPAWKFALCGCSISAGSSARLTPQSARRLCCQTAPHEHAKAAYDPPDRCGNPTAQCSVSSQARRTARTFGHQTIVGSAPIAFVVFLLLRPDSGPRGSSRTRVRRPAKSRETHQKSNARNQNAFLTPERRLDKTVLGQKILSTWSFRHFLSCLVRILAPKKCVAPAIGYWAVAVAVQQRQQIARVSARPWLDGSRVPPPLRASV